MNKPTAQPATPETDPAQQTSQSDEATRDPLIVALKAMLAKGSVPVPAAQKNQPQEASRKEPAGGTPKS